MSSAGNLLRPDRLWSLSEYMHSIHITGLLSVVRVMVKWPALEGDHHVVLHAAAREEFGKKLGSYEPILSGLGLSGARATLGKLLVLLKRDDCKVGDLNELCEELSGRLIDETDDKTFFAMTLRESDFYNNARRGWEKSIERFPTIVDDVEESSKCYALSRYPAAIFHSLQIVEAGLLELGTFLKVNDPHSGWTAVTKALKKVVDKDHKERTRFEKKNFAFLEQMQGTTEGLKNAWRNKISHVQGKLIVLTKEFSPEVAEEILFATRAFMRRLAEGLPPRKEPKALKKLLK